MRGCVSSRPFCRHLPDASSSNRIIVRVDHEMCLSAVNSRAVLVWLDNAQRGLLSHFSIWRLFLSLSLLHSLSGRPFGLVLQWYVLCDDIGLVRVVSALLSTRNCFLVSRFRVRFSSHLHFICPLSTAPAHPHPLELLCVFNTPLVLLIGVQMPLGGVFDWHTSSDLWRNRPPR